MTSKVIQGFFLGGQPKLASVQPRIAAPPPIQAKTAATAPATAFAGRPPGPPIPAFGARPSGPPAPASGPRTGAVQRHGAGNAFAVDSGALGLGAGGGKPLPDVVRGQMEAALGADFSNVRVHVGPQAERIGAIAFTVGSDIYFAPGRYQPDTVHGQQLLGHELAHVVQQRQGRVRAPGGSGIAVVQDQALEAEADRLGHRASSNRASVQAKTPIGTRRPSSTQKLVQRYVEVNGTPYTLKDITTVVKLLTKNAGKTTAGNVLKNWLKDNTPHSYPTWSDLKNAIEGRQQSGVNAQQKGHSLEESAAQYIGGRVANQGKFGQDEIVRMNDGSGRHVKLDVVSKDVYGIVGGAAKASNLEKFATICRDLKAVSEQDARRPMVFCDTDTPSEVLEIAGRIVGYRNVRVRSLYGEWQQPISAEEAAAMTLISRFMMYGWSNREFDRQSKMAVRGVTAGGDRPGDKPLHDYSDSYIS